MTDSVVNKLVTENYSQSHETYHQLIPHKKIEGQNWGAISVVTLGWFWGQFLLAALDMYTLKAGLILRALGYEYLQSRIK